MERKERFIQVLKSVKRDGIDNLISWLEKSTFFTDPASINHHSNYEGGLCQHSLNVYDRLVKLFGDSDSVKIVALLHDIAKAGSYEKGFRNVKNEDGKWEQVEVYKHKATSLPFGHGEKSAFMVERFIKLTPEELLAIRWHMGAYEPKELYNELGEAQSMYPLVIYTNVADTLATYCDEREEK